MAAMGHEASRETSLDADYALLTEAVVSSQAGTEGTPLTTPPGIITQTAAGSSSAAPAGTSVTPTATGAQRTLQQLATVLTTVTGPGNPPGIAMEVDQTTEGTPLTK